jgi:hypothetical protein
MKKVVAGIIALLAIGCQENELVSDFTGNEVVYALQSGSVYPISGSATFKEKKDGNTVIIIELTGTEGELQHPVHLHLGDIASPGADVAALLTPVFGKTGKSETTLVHLGDETMLNYAELIDLNACIKIHLADSGPDRDIILAGGNIGSAANARMRENVELGVCKSE